jgi:hypothetical protein
MKQKAGQSIRVMREDGVMSTKDAEMNRRKPGRVE